MVEDADALIARGNSAERAGCLDEACALYREAVRLAPRYAKAHINLGIALEAMGDAVAAAAAHERALQVDPADAHAAYNVGRLAYVRSELAKAELLLRAALRLRPRFPEARLVLARALDEQGQLEAAAAELAQALCDAPEDFATLYTYAVVLRRLDRLEEAKAALERALAVEPHNLDARGALCEVLEAQGDLAGAAAALEAALALKPDWADALVSYGRILSMLMRPVQAEQALRRAIVADPDNAGSYCTLGAALHAQCLTEEAMEVYRQARLRYPEDFDLESAQLFVLNGAEATGDEELFARHAAFGRRIEQAYPPRFALRPARDPDRRLRIGYVSGDFTYHVVTLFMLPVVERHDRAAFEVFCYSTSRRADDFTRRLAREAGVWRTAPADSAEQLAEQIHADGIDILIDLAGHSGKPQLRVFAQQPAPVQATWIGYLGTTGMTRMHYRITDALADPPGLTEQLHSETLARLPHSQWCYRPFLTVAGAAEPPAMSAAAPTFGSFVQAAKLSPATRRLWLEVLRGAPGSRLVVLGVPPGPAQERLAHDLAAAGIARERLVLAPYALLPEYFRWFNSVDVALDSTPYSGGTTTLDALWMGVPVVTAPGVRPASRSAASILTTLGLTECIASGPQDYVHRALALAGDTRRLRELRGSLRAKMQASPLMDEARFVRDLESLYRRLWRHYCGQG